MRFSDTLLRGLAPDGGLYVPESLPRLGTVSALATLDFPEAAAQVLAPFLEGDPLHAQLDALCHEAFTFPLPLTPLAGFPAAVLELFHGPTAAFKDVGARFLAGCLARSASTAPRTVLVATSGDTGGAVAAAFHGRPGFRVVVLYPKGGVSRRQEHQLTCWGDNVAAYAVQGAFDDCQRLVKDALSDDTLVRKHGLTTANSVNLGRILPQLAYHLHAAVRFHARTGELPRMIVPTGNVGNSVVSLWAERMGAPFAGLTFATNANRARPDYLASGRWEPRASVATLANAMDVGNPSNMERVLHLFPDRASLAAHANAVSVSDDTLRETIARGPTPYATVWDPHTAAAVAAWEEAGQPPAVLFATAHPAKFETIVEPLIGEAVRVPEALAEVLKRPVHVQAMENHPEALREVL